MYNPNNPTPHPGVLSPLRPGTMPSVRDVYDMVVLLTNAIAGLSNTMNVELPALRQQIAALNNNMALYDRKSNDVLSNMQLINQNSGKIIASLNENAELLRTLGQIDP